MQPWHVVYLSMASLQSSSCTCDSPFRTVGGPSSRGPCASYSEFADVQDFPSHTWSICTR